MPHTYYSHVVTYWDFCRGLRAVSPVTRARLAASTAGTCRQEMVLVSTQEAGTNVLGAAHARSLSASQCHANVAPPPLTAVPPAYVVGGLQTKCSVKRSTVSLSHPKKEAIGSRWWAVGGCGQVALSTHAGRVLNNNCDTSLACRAVCWLHQCGHQAVSITRLKVGSSVCLRGVPYWQGSDHGDVVGVSIPAH